MVAGGCQRSHRKIDQADSRQRNQRIATPLIRTFCPGEPLMEEQAGITAPLCLCLED